MSLSNIKIPYITVLENGFAESHIPSDLNDFDKAIVLFSSYVIHLDTKRHWFELSFLRRFYQNLLDEQLTDKILQFVKLNPTAHIDLVRLCRELNDVTTEQARLQMLFYFFDLAVADGHLHDLELEFIKNISVLLQVKKEHYSSILATYALYNPSLRKEFINQLGISTKDKLALCYELLEVAPSISDEELKKNYLRLVKEHHPDRMTHLGKTHYKKANEILRQINEAYDYVCSKRKLNE